MDSSADIELDRAEGGGPAFAEATAGRESARQVPFRLLKDVPELSVGDPGAVNLLVE